MNTEKPKSLKTTSVHAFWDELEKIASAKSRENATLGASLAATAGGIGLGVEDDVRFMRNLPRKARGMAAVPLVAVGTTASVAALLARQRRKNENRLASSLKTAGVRKSITGMGKGETFLDPRSDDFSKNQAFGRGVGTGIAAGAVPAAIGVTATALGKRRVGAALTALGAATGVAAGTGTYGTRLKKFRKMQKEGRNPVTGKKHNPEKIEKTRRWAERMQNASDANEKKELQEKLNKQYLASIKKKTASAKHYTSDLEKIASLQRKARRREQTAMDVGLATGVGGVALGVEDDIRRGMAGPTHSMLRRSKAAAPLALAGVGLSLSGYAANRVRRRKNENRLDAMRKTAAVEYRGVTFPGYNKPIASNRKGKKKMVLVKRGDKVRLLHFGQKGYEDYTQHKDKARRKNYLARSGGIRGKGGKLTASDPFSANYWARKELW